MPKFDGRGNVEGHLAKLELYMEACGIVGSQRAHHLIFSLAGSAAIWVESLGSNLGGWSYEALRERLVEHYREEATSAIYKLEQLVPNMGDLPLYNQQYMDLAVAAWG